MYMDPEVEWYFNTLSALASHIGNSWAVLMRIDIDDPEDVFWFVVPCDGQAPDEMEDLEAAADHPDRVAITIKDGILFTHPTRTPRSVWMDVQLKEQPELAGRII
jgi:hypothetical protein